MATDQTFTTSTLNEDGQTNLVVSYDGDVSYKNYFLDEEIAIEIIYRNSRINIYRNYF